MTRIVVIIVLLAIFKPSVYSQGNIDKKNTTQLIYIEADPFAYINNGYSIHLGYENWGMRFDLTKVKVDFTENFIDAFYSTKEFDFSTKISGIKVDYIGNRSNWTRHAFIGLDINYQEQSFTHKESSINKQINTFNVGVRTGYKINLFKGFYITPWAAIWKNVASSDSLIVGQDIIATQKWDWITTLHAGYALRF